MFQDAIGNFSINSVLPTNAVLTNNRTAKDTKKARRGTSKQPQSTSSCEYIERGSVPFCNICGYVTTTIKDFESHMSEHRSEDINKGYSTCRREVILVKRKKKLSYDWKICDICATNCKSNPYNFHKHMKKRHSLHACCLCSEAFKNADDLFSHLNSGSCENISIHGETQTWVVNQK